MSDANCPWCGAAIDQDYEIRYRCGSFLQRVEPWQSATCRDRVIAQRDAEIARLRAEWKDESYEVRKALATALRPAAEDALAEFAMDTPETLATMAAREIDTLRRLLRDAVEECNMLDFCPSAVFAAQAYLDSNP